MFLHGHTKISKGFHHSWHNIELSWTLLYHQRIKLGKKLNPNYVIVVKQDIDKLLTTGFIQFIKKTTWLSPIIVVPKKNGKMIICIDFRKLNATIKKDPYPLPFIDEMLNIITGYEAYSFLDGYSRYHQISIALKDRY
jgi:hypothetical protein